MAIQYQISIIFGADSRACLNQAVDIISQCFANDPAATYWLNDMPRKARLAYQWRLFYHLLKPASLLGCYFIEANNWESVIVMIPPKVKTDGTLISLRSGWLKNMWNMGYGGCKRLISEYHGMITRAKKRHMGNKPYYYIFQAATLPDYRGKGLASVLLKQCTDIAQKDITPIWLEATTENSRRVYAAAGFVTVEHLYLGQGKCDPNGEAVNGGDGLTIWGMKWMPDTTVIYSGAPYETRVSF